MDRKIFENIKWLNRKTLVAGALLAAVASGAVYYGKTRARHAPQAQQPHRTSGLMAKASGWFDWKGLVATYGHAFVAVQEKVDALKRADETNHRLELENIYLKTQLETARFSCQTEKAEKETAKKVLKLSQETGSRVGRTLASIPYQIPSNLMPQQLYTLGMSYFKSRDDEKAAVIFTFLTGLEEIETYKSPSNWLMTGIAWYRLDNFELADHYFEKILSTQESPENLRYQAHARLWKALSSARLSKHTKAQFWLRDLVDHHPHSREVKWVNSREVERATASVASDSDESKQ